MRKLWLLSLVILSALAGSALATDVKENWEKQCAKCHGPDGKGDTKMGKKAGVKDYTDAKVLAELKDDLAFKRVKEGLKEGDKKFQKVNHDRKDNRREHDHAKKPDQSDQ